ncbi:MAG: peptide chain release factor N(5)-glutamine methyltransferase [Treponema sp.]|jgi:release factor glutamine methyltransferase|nr:peptide chain release factor N(5)-glutamine methyltransferase [Treponema sp.]
MAVTVQAALAEGSRLFREAGRAECPAADISAPALDASLFLASVLDTDRSSLLSAGPRLLSPDSYGRFLKLVERRLSGECTAYILGKKEFWGLDFFVSPAVLVPRPDTEILVEAALEHIAGRQSGKEGEGIRVLDLCTGSGAVAVSLKHECPGADLTASDISEAALAVARENARRLLKKGPSGADAIRFVKSDLFDGIACLFDLVTANPPYIPSGELADLAPEVRGEPRLALDGGKDGLDIAGRLVAQARDRLTRGGVLLVEADPRQMAALAGIFEKNGYRNIRRRRDLSGLERVIEGAVQE